MSFIPPIAATDAAIKLNILFPLIILFVSNEPVAIVVSIPSGLFVSSIPFFGTRKIPTWKQGLALTKKLQKRLVFAVSEALFTTQTQS